MPEVLLDGPQFRLALSVEGYEFPDEQRGEDADWLVCRVDLRVGNGGEYTASQPVTLTGRELAELAAQAATFAKQGATALEFVALEQQLAIGLEDGDSVQAAVSVSEPTGPALTVAELEVERGAVASWANELARLTRAFPSRLT